MWLGHNVSWITDGNLNATMWFRLRIACGNTDCWGKPMIIEVQLTLNDFLTIKKVGTCVCVLACRGHCAPLSCCHVLLWRHVAFSMPTLHCPHVCLPCRCSISSTRWSALKTSLPSSSRPSSSPRKRPLRIKGPLQSCQNTASRSRLGSRHSMISMPKRYAPHAHFQLCTQSHVIYSAGK